ncbi:hypothetical protein I4U23_025589 [Adineta vaga]|nr:hypothetical protein I4U23_025589 [Adineta vaga]
MARSHTSARSEILFEHGSCQFILKQGDLLDENNVDAIVVPTPSGSETKPDTFAIYKLVYSELDKNGKKDIDQIRNELSGQKPKVFVKHNRKYVLIVPPYFGNPSVAFSLLKKTYTSCLDLAVKNDIRTIAFPAIGCGVIQFPINDAARSIYEAIEQFGRTKDAKKINEIRLVIYDDKVWQNFSSSFIDLSDRQGACIKFKGISTNDTKPAEIVPRKDDKRTSQKQTQDSRDPDYDSDFESESPEKQRRDTAQRSSNLNPDSHEFRPQDKKNQIRPQRRYLLNNKSTELVILQGDILQTKVDAIVNAANEEMLGGGGVDGVIHRAAGDELLKACKVHKKIYRDVRLPTGRSRILLSYKMSKTTHYIINTAGPRYDDYGPEQCKEQLTSCYKTSLALANLYDLETIGYTAISCGIFGYPLDEGAEVALRTVDQEAGLMREIIFVLREDEIYDAWVKKAKELGFTSLDHGDTDTSAPSQPNKKSKSIVQTSNENDDNKKPEKLKRDQGVTSAEDRNERNVVDASTSNKPKKGSTAANDRSPEQSRSDAVKQSNNKESTNDKENDDEQGSESIKKAVSRVAGRAVGDLHKQGFQSNSSPTRQNHQDEKGSSTNPTLKLHSGEAWGRGKPTNKDPKT